MSSISLKSIVLSLHRWIGLMLAPFFLMVIVSGGILALKPIVEDPMIAGAPQAVPASVLVSTLDRIDPAGRARQVGITADGQALTVSSQAENGPDGTFALGTGTVLPDTAKAFDLFGAAKSFHKNLLIGADQIVLWVTGAMLLIVVVGPLLSWLRLRNTLLGWHLTVGWLGLPLLIMAPLTGLMMTFHLGMGGALQLEAPAHRLPLAEGVATVATAPEVQAIISARRFKAGSAMIEAQTAAGKKTYVVDGSGQAKVLTGPGLIKSLHEGTWAGAWSGLVNLAISVALTLLTVTGFISWFRRWRQTSRRSGAADADILVAYASQTGTAGQLGEATFRALESGGAKVACMSLSGIRPGDLKQYRHVLIIASTTGEGELAEPGRAFLKALNGVNGLDASFALLALGDSRYRHFCAGGEALRSALVTAGAHEFLAMVRADGAPQAAWHAWLDAIQEKLALTIGAVEAPQADQPVAITLIERKRLDDDTAHETQETWQITFAVDSGAAFRPGDLLMLSPGAGETERCYSIGNSAMVDARRIVLTVSRVVWTDETGAERLGRMSNLLCRKLPVGAVLEASIRRHPHFNPPEDPETPIIMVATGCGVAPFAGFIEERAATADKTGSTWLMFGNRYREGDFLYRETLADWQEAGTLTRLSTAFSRDEDGSYITEKIVGNGSEIVSLLRDRGGVLYVCGRTRLGEGVDEALVRALIANDNVSETEAWATVQKWKAAGSLRQDLFD